VSDKDVLGKADALLRRHAIPLPGGSADSDVPVLTDLIEPKPAPPEPQSELARALTEQIVAEVEVRLATEVERRVADQIGAAVAAAIGDLHAELASTVAEAVRKELERRNVK